MGFCVEERIEKLYLMSCWMEIATKLLLELGYMLRMLGILLDGPALILSDSMPVFSVVLNTTVLWSVLKSKHLVLAIIEW